MKQTLFSVLALAGLASATAWTDAPSYSCPSNTNNTCTDGQKTGFDWSTLAIGSFKDYEQYSFSGYTCASSFGGGKKRDLLSGRTFQDKCITGVASSDAGSCPSMSCGSSSPKGFSVTEIQISVEFDCELEFHYAMPGGNTCKQKSSCSKSGSVVSNNQCGGATAVSVVYPSQTTGSGTAKSTCSIGVHSIGFDCTTASSTVSQSTYTKTTATSVSTTHASSSKTTPASVTTTPKSSTASAGSTTVATTAATTSVSSSAIIYSNSTSSSVSSVSSVSSSVSSSASSAEGVTGSGSSSIVTSFTTVVTDITTTSCPVTTTLVVSGTTSVQTLTTVSTIISTHVSTVCPKCSGSSSGSSSVSATVVSSAVSSGTSVAASAGVTTTASEAPCPTVVPNCLNTWMWSCGCPDNATPDCYCPSADYVNSVYACFSAYANSTAEIAAAQQYFQGICAAHVSSNPAIVTGASSVAGSSAPASATTPVTTITVDTTLTVPCTSSGSVISSSSTTTVISTQLTVPQVAFTTAASGSSSSVGLVAGTAPATVSATTTGGSSEAASLATGTGAYIPTTTLASSTVKGGTSPAASTVPLTGGSAKTSVAFGTMVFAALFAAFAL